MKYWFYTLVSPRPTFQTDMTAAEEQLMREHVAYWFEFVRAGKVLAFGPVGHPRAEYGGVALLELDDDEDPATYGNNDPTIKAEAGFRFECFPMPRLVRREVP